MRYCPMRSGVCTNECTLMKEDGGCRLVDVAESIVTYCRTAQVQSVKKEDAKNGGKRKAGAEKED